MLPKEYLLENTPRKGKEIVLLCVSIELQKYGF